VRLTLTSATPLIPLLHRLAAIALGGPVELSCFLPLLIDRISFGCEATRMIEERMTVASLPCLGQWLAIDEPLPRLTPPV
jgi:hypothetical protein